MVPARSCRKRIECDVGGGGGGAGRGLFQVGVPAIRGPGTPLLLGNLGDAQSEGLGFCCLLGRIGLNPQPYRSFGSVHSEKPGCRGRGRGNGFDRSAFG